MWVCIYVHFFFWGGGPYHCKTQKLKKHWLSPAPCLREEETESRECTQLAWLSKLAESRAGLSPQTFSFQAPPSLSSPCTTDSRSGVEKKEGDLSTWRQSRQRVCLPLFDLYLWDRSSEVRVRMTMPQQRTQSFTCTATPDPDTSGIPFPVGLKARTEGTCAWFLDAWWWWINVLVKTCLLITE